MAILTKLFAMRIVASNRLGFANNLDKTSDELTLLFSISSLSAGLNEKKATSEPEISAEQNNRISMITKETITAINVELLLTILEKVRPIIRSKGSSNTYEFNSNIR